MIEFKFSCPNCSQHIQCNDAYCGMQIVCPTCKNQIVVPQAPGSIPARPTAPSKTQPIHSQTAATQRPTPHLNAPKKSKARLIAICAAAALVFIGVIVYTFISITSSKSGEPGTIAVKPSVQKVAKKSKSIPSTDEKSSNESQISSVTQNSSDSRTPSASEIVRKVVEQYDSLASYSAKGKAISIIDMSGLDPSKIPGASDKKMTGAKNAEEMKKAMSKPQRIENKFSIRLSRPEFYLVEWEGDMGTVKSKGAVWSSGDGDFLLMDMGQIKYTKMKTRELALATATSISAGVANTMPQIFFRGQSSLLTLFREATRGDDETVDGEDCYVLTGESMGLKIHLWIKKSDFLIKQKQQVLGGKVKMPEMSEAQMEESYKKLGSNPTDKQKAQMKEAMKNMQALTSQIKGTMTETYENIEINKAVTKTDFNYDVPAGTKLSASLF